MTEEQRYRQSTDMKRDEIKCLKGIWDTLAKIQEQLEKQIKGSIVYADGRPYVIGVDLSKAEEENFEKEMESMKSYVSYSDFLDRADAEAEERYKDAKFNGEYHGETIDPSDPKYK